MYFNNPVTSIIGGWATAGSKRMTSWAYRDTSGNIIPLPDASYASGAP